MTSDNQPLGLSSNLSGSNTALAAKLLSQIKPEQTHLPGSCEYERARAAFWNKTQATASPVCIFQPHTAGDVSLAVIVLQRCQCPFAVKAGGHGKFLGESSIDSHGILIDLVRLNHVKVASDRKTVSVGPGNRWMEVYTAIEPLGLTVVGGRASTVGVGGFLLGGGISWYSNLYGLGSDNIQSYEVVLANGEVVTADATNHSDLYRALRGGCGNFGIVTSFTLDAYSYTGMWGGDWGWEYTRGAEVMEAWIKTGEICSNEDPKAFIILALTTTPTESGRSDWIWGSAVMYCDAVANPPAYREMAKVPPLLESTVIGHQTDFVTKMAMEYPTFMQATLWTLAIKVDVGMLTYCTQIWKEETQPLLESVRDFKPQLAIQYITSGVTKAAARKGGSVHGLAGQDPFIMFNAEPLWRYPEDNMTVYRAIGRAFQQMATESSKRGLSHDYLYSNYASQFQDPLRSYGSEENRFMRNVAAKYDPDQVFQKLRGAGFNLSGETQSLRVLESNWML